MTRQLAETTRTFQTYLELRREHADRFDDQQLELLDEDIERAQRDMEIAWLKAK